MKENDKLQAWRIDVAVLLIFFARPDTFARVFESVRAARPRVLLLWQDGPRDGKAEDSDRIERCRAIAENIDWECEVHKNYHAQNMGCDPSTFYADQWGFSIVDKLIILEDDQVPSQSYFLFCKSLLDRYENDDRISHICGYNSLGTADWCPDDYLFSYTGTGAWASWKRVAQKWDGQYRFLDNQTAIQNMRQHFGKRSAAWIDFCSHHRESGIAHWESILGMGAHLQSQYAIIPKRNLVQNLGISNNATHSSVDELSLIPKRNRTFYQNVAQEIAFPLTHPETVLPDARYEKLREREMYPSPIVRLARKFEFLCNLIRAGRFDVILKRLGRKSGR